MLRQGRTEIMTPLQPDPNCWKRYPQGAPHELHHVPTALIDHGTSD